MMGQEAVKQEVSQKKKPFKTLFLLWEWFVLLHFYGESDWAQVAQGDCGASILGHTQKLSGHGPRQLAVGGPVWVAGLEELTSRGHFQP